MSRFSKVILIAAVVTMVGAGVSMAQMTHEIKQGTVVTTHGNNLVVKMADGTTRQVEVQEGFMFDVDGVPTAVGDLKPGTVLTADIKTNREVFDVYTEEVRNGKVLERVGQTVIIRNSNGEVKKYHEVPEGVQLTSNGKPITLWDLKPGMNVTATIVSVKEEIVDERTITATGTAPKAAPKPAPKPAPAPAYTAPAALPSTASQLPLVGLTGLLMIVIGLGIGIIRRF